MLGEDAPRGARRQRCRRAFVVWGIIAAMPTRPEVRAAVVRQLGGYAGVLAGTEGAQTSLALPGAFRATGADWRGRQLYFPDATSAGDRERAVTRMANGVATIESRSAVTAGERYELYPDGVSAQEVDAALSEVLLQTLAPVTFARPLHSDRVTMPAWLDDWQNIRALHRGDSPCLVTNEDFSSWVHGLTRPPTGWVSDGPDVDLHGGGCRLRGPGTLAQDIHLEARRDTRELSVLVDVEIHAGAATFEVGSSTLALSRANLDIDRMLFVGDGNAMTFANPADQAGVEAYPLVSGVLRRTVTIAPDDELIVRVRVEGDEGYVVVRRVLCQWGAQVEYQLETEGSGSYHESGLTEWRPLTGYVETTVDLGPGQGAGPGQLVVYALAPYPDLAADDQETEAPLDLLMHGAIFKLSDREVAGREASVWDRRARKHGPAFSSLADRLRQDPVPLPVAPVVVQGA